MNKNLKNKNSAKNNNQQMEDVIFNHQQNQSSRRESRGLLESSAGMSDRMSTISDYAASSNSGNSSSGAFTDD